MGFVGNPFFDHASVETAHVPSNLGVRSPHRKCSTVEAPAPWSAHDQMVATRSSKPFNIDTDHVRKTLFTQLAVLVRRCNVLQHRTILTDPICVWTKAVLTQGRDAKTNKTQSANANSIISDGALVIPSEEEQDTARDIL